MTLSVICPIYNEEKYIEKCLDSLLSQDFPTNDLELLLVDGMSDDGTRDVVSRYLVRYPFIHLLDNLDRTVPYAMNVGVREAKGDLIMRVDAHTTYPQSYFSDIVKWHARLGDTVWNVGGVCETKVLNSNKTSEAIAKVMCDRFGVGASKFRTVVDGDPIETTTVPFGCYKRFVFEKAGFYNEKLTRVQDLEFNRRIRKAGGKIIMIPSIKCTYIPRETYKAIAKNRYLTGYWCINACFLTNTVRTLGLRHFVPFIFVLALIVPLLLSFLWLPSLFFSLAVAVLYLVCVTTRSFMLSDSKTDLPHLVVAFATIHFSYGVGSLKSLIDLLFAKISHT